MLVGTQRQELSAALFSAFPNLPAFDLMLATRVNQRRERLSTGLAGGLPSVIAAVLNAAEAEYWTPSLLAGAIAANPGNTDLQAFVARYPALDPAAAPVQPVNHYDTVFLVGRRVFLSRPHLRGHLQTFGQGLTSRVLVVTGPKGTGKTYSKAFIGYLLQFDPAYQASEQALYYVDLDNSVTDLEGLATRIGEALQPPPPPMPPRPKEDREQDSRWVPPLLAWLVKALPRDTDVWLVLDGFVQTLPQAALDLIDMLGDYADTQTTRLRLVLLNYPRPTGVPFSLHDEIPETVIDRPDIERFIEGVYRLSGKPADAARVTQAVDQILQQVDQQLAKPTSQPHQRLFFLSMALTNAAKQLLA